MPIEVTEIDTLQEYLMGVMERADHHGENVNEIVLAIAGAIVWRKDSDPIQVKAYEGSMKNVLWVSINGSRYTFVYNHHTGAIEVRGDSIQGNVVRELSNQTTLTELRQFFDSL